MDVDLQHPPEEIGLLVDKLAEGYDVVYGVARALTHSPTRNLLSTLTKRTTAHSMGIGSIRDISAFSSFRTKVREAFGLYQSPTVLVDVLFSWGTSRFAVVSVSHYPRAAGRSNYPFKRLLNQAMLLLTGFSTARLRLASWIGFALTLLGIAIFAYVIGRYIVGGSVPGFPFLAFQR